jgi:hypothetical protein
MVCTHIMNKHTCCNSIYRFRVYNMVEQYELTLLHIINKLKYFLKVYDDMVIIFIINHEISELKKI